MKRVFPNLIHNNQSGYIPGRNISENIRSILDIMDYTKVRLLINLEWEFLEKCLNRFAFVPDFTRWVSIFYKDIQSFIINNGFCLNYFQIDRGVRQGIASPHICL